MATSAVISADYICSSRNVDAAIYLLERFLGNPNVQDRRETLERMLARIRRTRDVRHEDHQQIINLYSELST